MAAGEGLFPATAMPDRKWWAALWPNPKAVLHSLGIAPGMTVLDLCCGDGWFTAPLALLTDGKVFGLDLDPEMLDAARAETARLGAHTAGWIEGDARDLDALLPGKVDYVLIANTFHGVPDQAALARAVAAVLKPGGLFAIVNWHARPRGETPVLDQPRGPGEEMRMTPAQTRRAVEPSGFVSEWTVELPPYHYGAVFRHQD